MERNSSFAKVVYLLALIATLIGFAAFSQTPNENPSQKERVPKDDSTKFSKRYRNDGGHNLDQFDIELKQLDLQMDHLKEEMKNLDLSKVQKEIDKAMKEVDMNKISEQVDKSLKSIDWNGINKQIDESVAALDKVKIEKIKMEMEKVKTQLEKQKAEMRFTVPEVDLKKIKIQTENAMKNAKRSIENAKKEIQNYREFTNALQNDGLIDKSKPYKIEVKDGELYINDKKQSKEVSEKYQKYYRKKSFTINVNEKGIKI